MVYSEEAYERRIEALFEKHQSVQNVGFSGAAYKPGLEAMERLDSVLGSPSSRIRTIHVAGTNGKGSVSSMLAACLSASGLRVGLYTSPHLVDFRERMRIIDEGMISRQEVWDFLEEYDAQLDGLSFFEVTTGMAFKWFADREVDVAVIEVGLGGRLDSTNIITPELSIITSIGLDHCAILGDTREAIAAEKAGIFKPGVPALVGFTDEETAPVFDRIAAQQHCPLFYADDFDTELPAGIELDLKGPCQDLNIRTVLASLELLDIVPDSYALSHVIELSGLRGRWERISEDPEMVCDIGHNPPALKINFARLSALDRPVVIVYGIMADKDLASISALMPSSARYVLCAPATSRSMRVGDLRETLAALRPDLDICSAETVSEAVDIARRYALEDPRTLIYIGGSTFVVSEAVQYIEKQK